MFPFIILIGRDLEGTFSSFPSMRNYVGTIPADLVASSKLLLNENIQPLPALSNNAHQCLFPFSLKKFFFISGLSY